jgi:hypothetical protein
MTPSQIILNDKTSIRDGAKKVLAAIAAIIKSGSGIMLQKNNSLAVFIGLGDDAVEVHLYTVDSAMALASALKYFYEKMVESHIKRVYAIEPAEKNLIGLLKSVGINVQKSDRPEYTWMADV